MSVTAILILVLIILLVLHLVEEIKTGFRRKLIIGEMPKPVFIGLNVVIYIFCFATLGLALAGSKLSPVFTWIFALGMLLNGLGHISIMIVWRGYFPGSFTAPLLAIVSALLISYLVSM